MVLSIRLEYNSYLIKTICLHTVKDFKVTNNNNP